MAKNVACYNSAEWCDDADVRDAGLKLIEQIKRGASSEPQQASHTPGPWGTGAMMTRVEASPANWRVPMLIADCHAGKYAPENEEERVANARLIAAAPDLLAACEAMMDKASTSYVDAERLIAAAIAKAKGGI
jgi:hypothetical protein